MWNPFKSLRRRSILPRQKYGRMGVTSVFAAAALVVILIAGWLIESQASNKDEAAILELARNADTDPATAVANAARANRITILSDIHESAAAKQLAARAIEKIVATSGLDVLVLEVGADLQPVIDEYLNVTPEDASLLVTNERALREPGPASRAYLDIYRTVWKLNERLGADRRIQVLAADLPGWPPARPLAPAELARKSAERDAHMQKRIEEVVGLQPGARVLVFVSGFHALKSATGELQTGGTAAVRIAWLGSRLARRAPEEVYTFLIDAPASVRTPDVTAYSGTVFSEILQGEGARRSFVTPITSEFDAFRRPLVTRKSPGLSFELVPRDYRLSDLADAYIYLR
jgi:hypothetical protein